jgi:hypothetical protein
VLSIRYDRVVLQLVPQRSGQSLTVAQEGSQDPVKVKQVELSLELRKAFRKNLGVSILDQRPHDRVVSVVKEFLGLLVIDEFSHDFRLTDHELGVP